MGAIGFFTTSMGKTAQEAFDAAVKNAQYEHGHAGYTGSIAEKREFVMIDVPKERGDLYEFAEWLIDNDDPRIVDKRGPAGCIDAGEGKFVFFGWASC